MEAGRSQQRPRTDPGRLLLSTPPDSRIAAYLLGGALLAIWTWWALGQGAFFGRVLLPGAVVIFIVLALTLGSVRLPIATRGPHVIALAAFLGLATWTVLSMLWSPARDLALDYSLRAFVYSAAFAAGLALTAALRRRMILSVVPFLAAGAIVTLVVLVKVGLADDVKSLVDEDGTLDYPFGYRNANAGFFAMVAFGAMPMITRAASALSIRVGAAALAATALSLVAVSQSRGSLLAIIAGALVLIACSRRRGWAVVALAVSFVPVVLVLPMLLDPYEAAQTPDALGSLQKAMGAALIAGALAGGLAAGATLLERRGAVLTLPSPDRRSVLIWGAASAAILLAAFTLLVGNPVTVIGDELDKASSSDASYGEIEGSRFTYGGGLNRLNFWEVALGQAKGSPIIGEGAGSFRPTYLIEGDGSEAPRNAHSLPLEVLGELGVVGLALLCTAFGAAIVAAVRSRRLGPDSADLSAVALVVAAVALTQASVDWSWFFGGQLGPLFALLGSAAAPAALAFDPLPIRARRSVVAVAAILSIVAIPLFASERLTLNAASNWRADLSGAYGALGTAADLNPFADAPLLVEAQIAMDNGDEPRALAALTEAEAREPDDWQGYYIAAQLLRTSDPARALEQIETALRLNPTSDKVKALRTRILEAQDQS